MAFLGYIDKSPLQGGDTGQFVTRLSAYLSASLWSKNAMAMRIWWQVQKNKVTLLAPCRSDWNSAPDAAYWPIQLTNPLTALNFKA